MRVLEFIKSKELVNMRIIKNGNGYELVTITPEDKVRLYEKLIQENKVIMAQCFVDARELLGKEYVQYKSQHTCIIAAALFEKLATKIYTVLSDAETVKTFNEKEQAAQITAMNNAAGSQV